MIEELLKGLKLEAKKIAASALLTGREIKHGHALEALSNRLGFKNWNTLRAVAVREPSRIELLLNEFRATNSEVAQSELGLRVQAKRQAGGDRQTILETEADFIAAGVKI